MDNYYLEWANLLLRWVHVITAIAWIGASFYFVFLDNSLTVPVDNDLKAQGANGELWAVHGGGFYHPVKFNVSPPKIPNNLHWFYWKVIVPGFRGSHYLLSPTFGIRAHI